MNSVQSTGHAGGGGMGKKDSQIEVSLIIINHFGFKWKSQTFNDYIRREYDNDVVFINKTLTLHLTIKLCIFGSTLVTVLVLVKTLYILIFNLTSQ